RVRDRLRGVCSFSNTSGDRGGGGASAKRTTSSAGVDAGRGPASASDGILCSRSLGNPPTDPAGPIRANQGRRAVRLASGSAKAPTPHASTGCLRHARVTPSPQRARITLVSAQPTRSHVYRGSVCVDSVCVTARLHQLVTVPHIRYSDVANRLI